MAALDGEFVLRTLEAETAEAVTAEAAVSELATAETDVVEEAVDVAVNGLPKKSAVPWVLAILGKGINSPNRKSNVVC